MTITAERLRTIMRYDQETGVFIWKSPTKYHPRMIEREAGCDSTGYILIRIDGRKYKAHRLAWLYVHGEFPTLPEIDHRDGNPFNNAISNLRPCTNPQNQANRKRDTSKALPKGVRKNFWSNRYSARISYGGKLTTIGTFDTIEEASAAYLLRATELYGEFARAA